MIMIIIIIIIISSNLTNTVLLLLLVPDRYLRDDIQCPSPLHDRPRPNLVVKDKTDDPVMVTGDMTSNEMTNDDTTVTDDR